MSSKVVYAGKRLVTRIVGPRTFAAARSVIRLGLRDWKAPYDISHRVHAWRNGFIADSYAIYDLPNANPDEYISDFVRYYRCSWLNASLSYFNHKITFRAFLMQAGVKQPETIGLVGHGRFLVDPLSQEGRYVSAIEFEDMLRADGGRFVVKPETGSWGYGIFLLDASDGSLIRQRGRIREPFHISDLPYVAIVERLVQQGDFWKALFPDSANSIRVLTGWAPGDLRPSIIRAVQRIGTADTVPTDNWSGGGICALVDLSTGRLGPGRVHPQKSTYPNRRFDIHPDTGAQIEGAVVPHWDRIQDIVVKACMSSPMHRYVGWDVLVDKNGEPVILEGNGNSDVNLLQVHGGLLTEPAARRFYESCGVI